MNQPNLINDVSDKVFDKYKLVNIPQRKDGFELIGGDISRFISTYISPYSTLIWVLIGLIFFFFIDAVVKDAKLKRKQKKIEQFKDIKGSMEAILSSDLDELQYNPQHTMNPTIPLNMQERPIVRFPNDIPLNVGGQFQYINDTDFPEFPNETLNTIDQYPGNLVYGLNNNNGRLDYQTGLRNNYYDAQDTNIVNPYGWANDFNSSTKDFIQGNVDINQDILKRYGNYEEQMKEELMKSMHMGPEFLDNSPEFDLMPPYAQ